MGMVISIQKTNVIAFGQLYPVPFQWTINGEQLEIVHQMKYLGVIFMSRAGLSLTFGPLKRNMCAAWALLKRQYGRLQCLSSVGLLELYMVYVPGTASYGCGVWGFIKAVATLCCCCSAATVTVSPTHVEGDFKSKDVLPNPYPPGRIWA